MKLSDYVIDFLVNEGVSHVFELIGGAITHLLDSICNRADIQCVSVHHEQAAAFAAEAYARINGNLGAAMATSGPGALNLVTGIGSCYFDSVPCLFITGQVNTYEYKMGKAVRQLGFQETDIISVVKPLTKYAELVTDAEKIRYHLEKAIYLARSGRPGPVLLDLPMNIQRAQIEPGKLERFFNSGEFKKIQPTGSCNPVGKKERGHTFFEGMSPIDERGHTSFEGMSPIDERGHTPFEGMSPIDERGHTSFEGMSPIDERGYTFFKGISPISEAISLIQKAKRPVILAGGGIRTAGATEELCLMVEKTGIPVVTSLMGLDTIPHDNPAFFGMIGAYGNRYSNLTLANCDFLLILGSRLDTRQTGTRPDTFARAAKKVHVDIDPVELNEKVKVDIAINCNVRDFLSRINAKLEGYVKPNLSPWYKIINGYKEKYPTLSQPGKIENIDPNRFMELLSSYCAEGDIVCIDVGQHQMWAAQSFRIKKNQRMLISGGMGAMGFALPAALGAAKAAPGRRIMVIAGDGGIQVNIQELDIIVSQNLPVKLFVMNNQCLGMVRQFQDMYFGGRQQSTVIGYSCPDLGKVALAYGIPSYVITSLASAQAVIETAFQTDGPALVEVKLEQTTCVEPKLVVNRPIEDMSPHLDRTELKKIMLIDLTEEMDFSG